MRFASALLGFVLLVATPAAAKDDRREAESPDQVKPGRTALLKAPKGMHYFLRVPRSYDAKKGARLIVFLHGSNMKGLDYVGSLGAKKSCEDDILCCPNGEVGADPYGTCNFTQESAPLVADVTLEVQKAFKTTISYVGGHSQGGFLTYSVIMLNPDLFQGAMPMAGDCWIQNEPNLWETRPEIAKVQHEIAIAVVHGKNDPIVEFAQGEHAYDVFRDAGWQKLRFFTPERAAHMFNAYPVEEAIDWLDAMNGRSEKKSLELANEWAKQGEWGWALVAAKASKAGAPKIVKGAEDAAAKAAGPMAEAMKGRPADWIPKWLEFWRVHGGTDAAKALVDEYLGKRAEQRDLGARLLNESEAMFRADKRADAYAVLERIVGETPYTYGGYFAVKGLSRRK